MIIRIISKISEISANIVGLDDDDDQGEGCFIKYYFYFFTVY
jgi:hypothetical protein